jgi:hypothetical protein
MAQADTDLPGHDGDRKLCEKTHSTDAVFSLERVTVPTSSIRTLGIPVKRWRSKMNTIIAALNRRPSGETHPWRPDLSVIIAISLIAVLAALYMATHYPLPENIYAVPMTIT